jgi:hypothetical protein
MAACLLPLGQRIKLAPPSAGLGRRSLLRRVNVAMVPVALQDKKNAGSALEDRRVQASRTTPISAIPVRSPSQLGRV